MNKHTRQKYVTNIRKDLQVYYKITKQRAMLSSQQAHGLHWKPFITLSVVYFNHHYQREIYGQFMKGNPTKCTCLVQKFA